MMAEQDNSEITKNACASIQHAGLTRPAPLASGAVTVSGATNGEGDGEALTFSNAGSTVLLDAELKIRDVAAFHRTLCELFQQTDKIELDASRVISVDTANLQMLVICRLNAHQCGKEIIIVFPSETFVEAAELLGLSAMLGIDEAATGLYQSG